MASAPESLARILALLGEVPLVNHRKMMGEYLLYSNGVLFGGIYDDRFLIKPTPASVAACPEEAVPYEGAKPMRLVTIDDPAVLGELVGAVCFELASGTRA